MKSVKFAVRWTGNDFHLSIKDQIWQVVTKAHVQIEWPVRDQIDFEIKWPIRDQVRNHLNEVS